MSLGIDPIHFGLIIVVNLTIGMSTPPVGLGLFVGCGLANVTIEETWHYLKWYLFAAIISLLIITYCPIVVTYLPNLLMK
jgi:C4-dicarboxylate transporter DctM subunit